jgi:hypothetical protein
VRNNRASVFGAGLYYFRDALLYAISSAAHRSRRGIRTTITKKKSVALFLVEIWRSAASRSVSVCPRGYCAAKSGLRKCRRNLGAPARRVERVARRMLPLPLQLAAADPETRFGFAI